MFGRTKIKLNTMKYVKYLGRVKSDHKTKTVLTKIARQRGYRTRTIYKRGELAVPEGERGHENEAS